MAGKPKPTHLRVVKSGRPAPSPVDAGGAAPRCPDHLTGEARAAWLRWSKLLTARGVLSEMDATALEQACQCYALCRQLQDTLTREGFSYQGPTLDASGRAVKDSNGDPVMGMARVRPEVSALDTADKRLRQWLGAFGMTPSDRARVAVDPDAGKKSPGSEYFG